MEETVLYHKQSLVRLPSKYINACADWFQKQVGRKTAAARPVAQISARPKPASTAAPA
ncbi:MAG: hypothetical protein AAF936_08905 [Pseudomonadota bacterium]